MSLNFLKLSSRILVCYSILILVWTSRLLVDRCMVDRWCMVDRRSMVDRWHIRCRSMVDGMSIWSRCMVQGRTKL